jgi:hypothetical protein
VHIEALGDCPLGVQGWHHKIFPASIPIDQLISKMFSGDDEPVMWPLKAPN